MNQLPKHLQKYIVSQNYEKYTPVDQACWRYIMRQLQDFLSKNAHECYLEGLEKTGVGADEIPHIEKISEKLQRFGWRALPVSGFIPPAAFMELQSLGVLPIASDMRTLEHLMYTPAPDIVHEAAGHAPILIHPEFSDYLRQYAQVAKKAIISREDLDVYEAIRNLSDLKEKPDATEAEIEKAQKNLDAVAKNISHISEASELSRMNWWTAEYGLIGTLENPKIFGAGLLSSVGESKWCLSEKVKKIPLTIDCLKFTYDITEPQPQLFVTPDFITLGKVLNQMANQMAFRSGGVVGIQKAILAKTVNTVELNSGIQISGQVTESVTDKNQNIAYLRFQGPTQLSYNEKELEGHHKVYHSQGFGTAIGYFKQAPNLCPSLLSDADLIMHGLCAGEMLKLEFMSEVIVEGRLSKTLRKDGKLIVMSFENCTVKHADRVLFEPSWGTYDMAVGSQVISVFGGASDREAYGDEDGFIAARVPTKKYSQTEMQRFKNYVEVAKKQLSTEDLSRLVEKHLEQFPTDWLLLIEAYELAVKRLDDKNLSKFITDKLEKIASADSKTKELISEGMRCIK